MLANEIVDPLPAPAVELMNKLGMEATPPGGGEGQCMAEKYFDDDDGRETRVLLAYNCKNGNLIYLWSPTCCYGVMTDYHKFHDKLVAYGTKDDPTNIHIDTLKDLGTVDEAMFAISHSTPPEKRITSEKIGEAQARKLIAQKVDPAWPTVSKKPTVESLGVELVIGRDGLVKQVWSYSPVEDPVKDAVLDAIKKWKFTPQNIDGVPTQIETSLAIPLPSEIRGAGAKEPQIRPIFDRMRSAGDLRFEGCPGFHMKASFQSQDGGTKGTYEETWLSNKKWRKEVILGDVSLVEVRTEDAFYRVFPGKVAPRIADDVMESLSFNLPGDNGSDLHEPDWSSANVKLSNLPVLRLSNGYINPKGRPDATTLQYYIEEKTGNIRGRYHYSMLTVFNDLQTFNDKSVARKLTVVGGDVSRLEISIDTLEPASNVSDSLFQVSGKKPVFTSEEEQRFTQPRLIYSTKLPLDVRPQNVICAITVDEHGHVRDVDVKGTSNEFVIKPLHDSIMQWEYEPATFNGHPSLGLVQLKVN